MAYSVQSGKHCDVPSTIECSERVGLKKKKNLTVGGGISKQRGKQFLEPGKRENRECLDSKEWRREGWSRGSFGMRQATRKIVRSVLKLGVMFSFLEDTMEVEMKNAAVGKIRDTRWYTGALV
ncbi:hypothetical protein CEXT_545691 [Caerostris extrusa]|uniref:Uncharacterized protein n=1 Tax=Caerostris extrusa TaxID=172846 RepID=A0AAV4NJ77_CAEEX|nr:hypothetical protein CEXT_545691 [Caerostris extrusa]